MPLDESGRAAVQSSLVELLDDARAALFAGEEAGIATSAIAIRVPDLDIVRQTADLGHHRETPLRLLGVEVCGRPDLPAGAVELIGER